MRKENQSRMPPHSIIYKRGTFEYHQALERATIEMSSDSALSLSATRAKSSSAAPPEHHEHADFDYLYTNKKGLETEAPLVSPTTASMDDESPRYVRSGSSQEHDASSAAAKATGSLEA